MTTSETILTLTIWVLTAAGLFFGCRAAWRKARLRRQKGEREQS